MALPVSKNLTIYKGDTYRFSFRLRERTSDGDPGDYVDLEGVTAKAEIRAEDESLIAEFDTTIADQSDPDNTGKVELYPSTEVTGETNFGNGVWDAQLTFPNGDVRTYLKGKVTAVKEITRA